MQSARPEISNGPVPPIFDARIHGIGNDIPNLDAARRSDFDSLGGRNRIKNISPSGSFGERLAVHCSRTTFWQLDVRFGSKADMCTASAYVRFT
ncbi:MAG: hypothetical protein WBE96_17295, partial [Pseudolabrys sp.]